MSLFRRTTVNGKTTTEVIPYRGPQVSPVEKVEHEYHFFVIGKSKVIHQGREGFNEHRQEAFAFTDCGRSDLKQWTIVGKYFGEEAEEYWNLYWRDHPDWVLARHPGYTVCKVCFMLT